MSRFQKMLKYLATERGRMASLYCVSTVGIGIFVSRWAPHSVGIEKYREFATCYKFGIEKKLSDKVHHRFEKALNMVKDMSELERSRFKMFCVFGMEPRHFGSKHSIWGSYVGIPDNFNYETANDIPKGAIVMHNKPIPWSTEGGKKIEQSLVLTEDEQIFAMLKEILALRTWEWPLNCFYPVMTLFTAYGLSHYINTKLKLFQRPLSLRLVMYSLVGVFMIGNYCFATDATQIYHDSRIDKEIATMGKEMVDAGVRYYDKILQRNIALREITGDYSLYSSGGNVNFLVRQRTMPFTARKDFFQEQLKKLQEGASMEMN
uniref:CSON014677 protein n=1 Tax=Culicoides sonorensis TaxID=179676 RepID=A0A336KRZ3_CULSO